MRALIPMTYFRITVTFKLRRAKKQTSDIWRNLRYSNQLTDTRTKHSYFVTMSPSNQNNQLMTSNNKTYNTKETSNRQIRGDAYLEKIPSNSGFVRKKRCVQDICPGTPKGLTYFGGLSRTQTKSIVHIISNQPLTTTTPLASSTEDVSVTITVGSSMEQALETNSVINVETNEPTTELNLTSSTTNSALMNSFPPISTGKTVITEAETASATSSGVVDKDISGIYSSFTTSKPLTQPKSLSALTPPSSSTTNEQINVRSTSSTVTTTHVQTGTAILRNEERARADNETDEIPSILSSPMQTAHTMPDSGAVATTILDAVGVLLMALLTVSIS